MLSKYSKNLIRSTIVCLCLGIIFILIQYPYPNYTKKIVKEIDEVSIYLWNDLGTIREQVIEEMEDMPQGSNLQEGYYVLGFLDSLVEKFETSNDYYFKALSLNGNQCLSICGRIYKELSYNFLALNDEEKAKYYFDLAEAQVTKFHDQKLRSSLYRRFSQGVLLYTHYGNSIISLLEYIIQENLNEYDYLEAYRMLANIYLESGYYEKSINYLLEAYRLSVWHDYPVIQLEIKAKLGQVYFFNGDYEQAIVIFEQCVDESNPQHLLIYIVQLMESYRRVQGYEAAIQHLDDYVNKLSTNNENDNISDDNEWVTYWYYLIRADLAISEGEHEEAAYFIEKLQQSLNGVRDYQNQVLSYWEEKIELDYLVSIGVRNNGVIERYEEIYDYIHESSVYVTAKVNLLDSIVKQSAEIGNYELGYRYLRERLSNFKNNDEFENSLQISEIYDKITKELERSKLTMVMIMSGLLVLLVGVAGAVIYIVWKKQLQIKALSNEIKSKQDIDTLTNTLTKEALYESLEFYMGKDDILNFIIVNIDDFKRYNEICGYLAGDKILQTLAQVIQTIFPEAYISRHAGDHFIIVSPNEQSASLLKLEYLFDQVYEKNVLHTGEKCDLDITLSAGVSSGKILTRLQIDQHINNATSKLELSKKSGSNKLTV